MIFCLQKFFIFCFNMHQSKLDWRRALRCTLNLNVDLCVTAVFVRDIFYIYTFTLCDVIIACQRD